MATISFLLVNGTCVFAYNMTLGCKLGNWYKDLPSRSD